MAQLSPARNYRADNADELAYRYHLFRLPAHLVEVMNEQTIIAFHRLHSDANSR